MLVCGATGYIGGRLVLRLLEPGYRVRCLVRRPQKLAEFSWRSHPHLEVMEGELQDRDSIVPAAEGVDVAY